MHKLSGYCYILIKLYISVASITNDIFIRKLGHYMNSVNRSHVVYKPSTTNTQTYALQKLVFRASLCICLNTATADPKLVEVGTIGTKLTKRGEHNRNIYSRLQSTDIIKVRMHTNTTRTYVPGTSNYMFYGRQEIG